jgi:hypothetical protein
MNLGLLSEILASKNIVVYMMKPIAIIAISGKEMATMIAASPAELPMLTPNHQTGLSQE